jgi:uncharacterized protein YkwD
MSSLSRPHPLTLFGIACSFVLLACGDGIGEPIRAVAAKTSLGGDASSVKADAAVRDAGRTARAVADAGRAPRFDAGQRPRMDVPAGDYCASVASWPDDLANAELALLDLINSPRTGTPGCGSRGGPCGLWQLHMVPQLRCSARKHSLDMAQRHYFAKVDPDGNDPAKRIAAAGLIASASGEIIITRAIDAPSALSQLLQANDPQAIANLTDTRFMMVGIGHDEDLWTIDFAAR